MRRIFITLLAIIGLFIGITNIDAEQFTTDYISITNTSYMTKGKDISFSNIYFERFTPEGNEIIGAIRGKVENISGYYLSANMTVNYYSRDYQIIATSKKVIQPGAPYDPVYGQIGGTLLYLELDKDDFLGNYTIDDIDTFTIQYNTTRGNRLPSSQNQSSTNGATSTNSKNSNKPSENSTHSSKDYVLDKYHVDIIVNRNNTFNITETITAYYNIPKHGIIRKIPLQNKVKRLDGTESKNRAQITEISVDKPYVTRKNGTDYEIKIGSSSEVLTGKQTYTIKYKYNIGKDPLKDSDEFYYNIIGTEWDTAIGGITFKITFPEDINKKELGFSSGFVGSTANAKVNYNVDGNVITGSYNGILDSYNGLTIRYNLPEGYFVGAKYETSPLNILMMAIPLACLLIAILIWRKFGKDDLVVETVEFYPPENMNSLEADLFYNGKSGNKGVTSLLIYLANKGYLQITDKQIELSDKLNLGSASVERTGKKIEELQKLIEAEKIKDPASPKIKYYENMLNIYKDIDKPIDYEAYGLTDSIKSLNKKSKFTIKKLKDYDGLNVYEEMFMDGLFENDITETNDKILYNKFYTTKNSILNAINSKKNKELIFEKSANSKKKLLTFMAILSYLIITIPPMLESEIPETVIVALLFPLIGFTVLINLVERGIKNFKTSKASSITIIVFGLIWSGGFGGIPWLTSVLPALIINPFYFIPYLIGIISIIGIIICIIFLPKRTKYGNEMLGKLRGFKNFLETAEKEKLEALVSEHPTYFYDILPYTYVLGVSDKWIEKFESISMQAPDWYDSTSGFQVTTFNTFITTTMTTAERSMSSSPVSSSGDSSSSGSSSSGGGSSGGGSGGGGGSSW